MVEIKTEKIVAELKKLIDRNGPSYLTDEPYKVYLELLHSGATDRKTAASILHLLTSGMMENVDCSFDAETISVCIRRECSFNKRMADKMALILTSLYSRANIKDWSVKNQEGLRQFMKEDFNCLWKGFAVWDAGNGTVDCHYEANIVLVPTDEILKDKELAKQLKKNPYLTKETIHDLFAKRLRKYLDDDFEYYCTCEDYYEPTVEDYGCNLESNLHIWSKENGFEYISFEGDGYDDGYEPKLRNNWY